MSASSAAPRSSGDGTQRRQMLRLGRRTWAILLALLTFLGVTLRIMSTVPRLTVQPTEQTSLESPFLVPLRVRNEGLLSARSVTASCSIEAVKFEGNIAIAGEAQARFETAGSVNLEPDEAKRFTCSMVSGTAQVQTASISAVVRYRPWLLPWHQERSFRFVAFKDSNGLWRWTEPPISESAE